MDDFAAPSDGKFLARWRVSHRSAWVDPLLLCWVPGPVLIAELPKIMELLAGIGIGLEPARPERPGVYGLVSERGFS